ncbi:hypothetical protein [Dactylosporangium sp. CA-233914]
MYTKDASSTLAGFSVPLNVPGPVFSASMIASPAVIQIHIDY